MPTPPAVGSFEVLERLGAGGMGVVYKARDRKLNRFVALKFLPETANDAARERFQREALAIAALNHPHICTLYEAGEHEGQPYLVMELLEGETLKARMARGALDPEQLLDWSVQITDALDAAHRRGVLHRDLKPENIWVAPGGHIKVLDFGLARLETEVSGGEATMLTSPGVAMGTVPYMSPEQARGEALDARSDLFSFGSVFYEMASGKPAFPAKTAADSVAAVLRGHPPKLSEVRPELPPMIGEVAERCLEKDPDLRYQSAADLRGELKRLKRESSTASGSAVGVAALPAPGKRPAWLWPAAAVIAIAAAGVGWWRLRPVAPVAPVHLQMQQITFSGQVQDAVISPDGKFLAHIENGPQGTSLHLLSIASGSDVEIRPPAPGCCQAPSFSRDGSQVYFLENQQIKAIPVLGGAVRVIVNHACSGAGFSPDGSQIAYLNAYAPIQRLEVARADGSQARVLHQLPAGRGYFSQCWISIIGQPTHSPAWSPDGRWIAASSSPANGDGSLDLVSVADGGSHTLGPALTDTTSDVNWLPDGSGLVFAAAIPGTAASQVWEVAYPSGRLTQLTNDLQGYSQASLAGTGQLALIHAAPQASLWAQTKAGGEFQQIPGGGTDQDGIAGVSWTPDGGLVSFRNLGGQWQLWIENRDGSGARKVPVSPMPDGPYDPRMASNGQIVFGSNGTDSTVWRVNGDGSALTEICPASKLTRDSGRCRSAGERRMRLRPPSSIPTSFWGCPARRA